MHGRAGGRGAHIGGVEILNARGVDVFAPRAAGRCEQPAIAAEQHAFRVCATHSEGRARGGAGMPWECLRTVLLGPAPSRLLLRRGRVASGTVRRQRRMRQGRSARRTEGGRDVRTRPGLVAARTLREGLAPGDRARRRAKRVCGQGRAGGRAGASVKVRPSEQGRHAAPRTIFAVELATQRVGVAARALAGRGLLERASGWRRAQLSRGRGGRVERVQTVLVVLRGGSSRLPPNVATALGGLGGAGVGARLCDPCVNRARAALPSNRARTCTAPSSEESSLTVTPLQARVIGAVRSARNAPNRAAVTRRLRGGAHGRRQRCRHLLFLKQQP
jgi:hypothetical protein